MCQISHKFQVKYFRRFFFHGIKHYLKSKKLRVCAQCFALAARLQLTLMVDSSMLDLPESRLVNGFKWRYDYCHMQRFWYSHVVLN